MERSEVAQEVRTVVADLFQLDAATIVDADGPDSIEAWDSLQHVNIVLDLEGIFGIAFSEEDVEGMVDVGAVIAAVERLLRDA